MDPPNYVALLDFIDPLLFQDFVIKGKGHLTYFGAIWCFVTSGHHCHIEPH